MGKAQEPGGKIVAIQLLRALAALIVAAGHIAFAFADHLPGGLGDSLDSGDGGAGQIAVMLFFVVSGYVMVISSERLFGRPGARRTFWIRRFIRIMPPYWIATVVLVALLIPLDARPVDPVHVVQSLLLIPYWPADGLLRPLPVLWVGWSLFYEMLFYALFGLFIMWRREAAVAGVIAVLVLTVIAGLWVPPVSAPLFAITRPVILVFGTGVLLALWRARGGKAPAWLRWIVLLAVVPVWWFVPYPVDADAMGFDFLAWAALPALMIAFAAISGPLALPMPGIINKAGDASYAIYLFHVPLAWFWLPAWGRVPFFDAGPWDYFVSALAATIILAWLFNTYVERPMMAALNRRFAAPHSSEEHLRKTP